jgi:integrase
MVLDEAQLLAVVQGFAPSSIGLIVAVAALTGARRNEILALRWGDLSGNELTIARSVDGYSQRTKSTKTGRSRTIRIDEGLRGMLEAQRGALKGVGMAGPVDPIFPGPRGLRNSHAVSAAFKEQAARLGYPKLRFHDLRASHETLLLDRGVPVHVVAARCGHDPAMLLRSYAKRTRGADAAAAAVLSGLTKGLVEIGSEPPSPLN